MPRIKLRIFCLVSIIAFVASLATIASVARITVRKTHPISPLNSTGSTDSRGSITVHASGRGNPWINLSDGRYVKTSYTGAAELQQVLAQNLARPLALASADFDEDGVPDLIGAYAGPGGGIITLHRGNVDSIYPNAPEAQQRKTNGTYTDSPFLSPALVFEVAEPADFVGAGDFDADSHWDVVAAARRSNSLWLLPGDGRGSFGAARRIDLPGRVTTLVTGEINRADGLTDVVVGVVAADGPKALVFESPEGALRGEPEAYSLPAEATAMALGRLDGDYTMDLAVGAGNDLIVVYGRDRKLSLDEIRQAEVPKTRIGRRSFPFAIKSAAIGDFTGDHRTGLSLLSDDGAVYLLSGGKATGKKKTGSDRVEEWKSEVLAHGPWPQATQLVCARVSSIPVDNLMVVDSADHKLHTIVGRDDPRLRASGAQLVSLDVEGEPMAVLPMRLNVDALSDLVILRNGQSGPTVVVTLATTTFTVTNTNDDGPGSLRQAILDANASAGLDTISFSIGSGVQTISVGSSTAIALPLITDPVIIDGTTQPGYAGSPPIELNGTSAVGGAEANGLIITAGSSTIRGLVINRFHNGAGINLASQTTTTSAGGNVIAGNFIGTDVNGTAALGNGNGVFIDGPSNNTIGGTAAGARNVISGSSNDGINIARAFDNLATGNLVQGNYIGTDVNGTASMGNTPHGVLLNNAANNTIGGTAAGARNVISGNDGNGIGIQGSGATGNLVQGNYIGTDANGTVAIGNTADGVDIIGAANNTIGGTAAGARNVISGNSGRGIVIGGTGNLVQGNYIGTDVNGTAALGNSFAGVFISGGTNNTIGGTVAGARNVISGNNGHGIEISDTTGSSATGNLVQGNFIGTDVSGTADLGNLMLSGVSSGVGVIINADNNTIGGTAAGARNVISGNDFHGIVIGGGTGNLVQGNYIGTDVNGTADVGNSFEGVFIGNAPNNTIGGTVAGARNIISGNNAFGILIVGSSSTGNLVQGNYVGTDVNGAADLGNSVDGVFILGANNNTIGGTSAGAPNVISGNNGSGIDIGGDGNHVEGNYIGTDVNGTADLGNAVDGVLIGNAANNIIGGTAAGTRNVISGNNIRGIEIGSGATGNQVQGNFIGTDVNATADLGNSQDGILIASGAQSNTIGGTTSGAGNTIAFNDGYGVFVASGVNNAILSNSIHSNTALGIDLEFNGVTSNDACDADTGANNLQNFPVLTSASTTAIEGTLNSTANTTFTIQFFANTSCDPSGNGEGRTFIGSTTVTTDGNCNASFTFPTSLSPGQVITATATDPSNNTSEFSQCLAVIVPTADLSVTKTDSPDPVIRGNNITYTVIVTNNGSSSAANASLSDVVPTNTKFVSNSGTADWSCTNPTTKGMATGTITCVKSILASGESATFTIVVQVKSGAKEGTIITNTATVSSSTSDPNTSNNSATTTTAVIRR